MTEHRIETQEEWQVLGDVAGDREQRERGEMMKPAVCCSLQKRLLAVVTTSRGLM
jgi:hypothetical protein